MACRICEVPGRTPWAYQVFAKPAWLFICLFHIDFLEFRGRNSLCFFLSWAEARIPSRYPWLSQRCWIFLCFSLQHSPQNGQGAQSHCSVFLWVEIPSLHNHFMILWVRLQCVSCSRSLQAGSHLLGRDGCNGALASQGCWPDFPPWVLFPSSGEQPWRWLEVFLCHNIIFPKS